MNFWIAWLHWMFKIPISLISKILNKQTISTQAFAVPSCRHVLLALAKIRNPCTLIIGCSKLLFELGPRFWVRTSVGNIFHFSIMKVGCGLQVAAQHCCSAASTYSMKEIQIWHRVVLKRWTLQHHHSNFFVSAVVVWQPNGENTSWFQRVFVTILCLANTANAPSWTALRLFSSIGRDNLSTSTSTHLCSKDCRPRGLHSTEVVSSLLTQWPQVQFSELPKISF